MKVKSKFSLLIYLLVVIFTIYALAPIYWLFMGAFVPERLLLTKPPSWLPYIITLKNFFRAVVNRLDYLRALRDSVMIATFTAIISVILSSIAAYCFAKIKFPLRKTLLLTPLAVQTIPAIAIVIPVFITILRLGLYDTYLGVILVQVSFELPFLIWILTTYFLSIPSALEESAWIDGCNRLQSLFRIVMPLSVPGLIATYIIAFLDSWGGFLFQLALTHSKVVTLPVTIAVNDYNYWEDYGALTVQGFIAVIPVIILATVFQKYIVKGLTAGGVKA